MISKEEDCSDYEGCLLRDTHQPQQSEQELLHAYNMTDQDIIDEQIATINSLTISDQQHPMDTLLDTRPNNNNNTVTSASTTTTTNANNAVPNPFRSIFTDSTAFTPQSTDRHLFRNHSFSIQPDYPGTPTKNVFMQYNPEDGHHHLSRRESYPNLSTSYLASSQSEHRGGVGNYTEWQGYLQPPTQEQSHPLSKEQNPTFLMHPSAITHLQPDQQQQPQSPYRKFSVDVPPSFVSKRLDILDKRLTPSYSNPDLSSARRMGSLDAGTRLISRRYDFDDFMDHPQFSSSSSSTMRVTPPPPSLFQQGYTQHHPHPLANPLLPSSANHTMNPLLVSHLMRQMQPTISRPPSPTSRKNSLSQLRRTSSATTIATTTSSAAAMTITTPSTNATEQDRFAMIRLEDVVDEIYALCKDQYGCRFFQKKLEEQKPDQRDIIFVQIYPHFVELMTDPFGNYLCQKLMEYCTDAQRTMIVEQVASAIISISLNMHGTRAVQRMIEFLNPEQIDKTIEALSPNVVTLIKDINGNHVIQKCLQRLSFTDKQFVYDAVSESCVEVATHRHGCCVLQRCIDFSAENQKKQLVNEIIRNALTLVQDPYGNYVVQYVLELGDAQFSDQLIRQFIGHIGGLSVQKYSSNVMEKCIRVAEESTRRHLIEEMINRPQLEKLLKDSYANYVVQTALDFADETQHQKLGDCIRPLLPAIRNTSYCKRIQGKLNREPIRQHQSYQQQQPYYQPPFQSTYSNLSVGVVGVGMGNNNNNSIHPLMSNNDISFAGSPFISPHHHQHAFSTFPNP